MRTKKSLIFVTALLSMACATLSAQQYRFVAGDNSIETKVCVLLGSNEIAKLKTTIRIKQLNKHHIANSYRCNDLALSKFAYKYHAADTFKYINRFSHHNNKVIPSVNITDIAMLRADENAAPITVYVKTVY